MDLMSKNLITPENKKLGFFSLQQSIKLNPLDPDFQFEDFWYTFKQSMINFYYFIKKDSSNVELWSNNLNQLKTNKKYCDIEKNIRDYMGIYALDLIKYKESLYYDNLLITNIKRWNKISTAHNFCNSIPHSKILCVFLIISEIKNDKTLSNYLYCVNSIEKIIQMNDFDLFLKIGIENFKTKILDELRKIPDYNFNKNLKRLFPTLEFNPSTKSIKICQMYKKNNIN